ncbi:hypothetical protein ACHAPT_007330 [Fusarium lateritium]
MLRPKFGPATVAIILLALYSTTLSGLWLVIATIQPRWGFTISTTRGFSPSNAATLTALLGKTIEITSIAVFISCLGQVLTRRAVAEKSTGITLADITVRNWVIQPGFLLTHFQTLAVAGRTLLGVLSLLTLVATILYTTASEALVSPKLKYGKWETRELTVPVHSYYGNYIHAGKRCLRHPAIGLEPKKFDLERANAFWLYCLGQELGYMSSRDLLAFSMSYDEDTELKYAAKVGNVPRPAGRTILHDNVAMEAIRVNTEFSDVAALYKRWGRIVDNVTVSIPHPGVWSASRSPENKILQPEDLSNTGGFSIRAAVVSPTLNTLCVKMRRVELDPLVYKQFPNSDQGGFESWAGEEMAEWDNSTVVDDLFRWGPRFGRRRPVFESLPRSGNFAYYSPNFPSEGFEDAGYFVFQATRPPTNYTLCQMRSWLSTDCSTQLDVSGAGQPIMRAHCGDGDETYKYDPSLHVSSDSIEAPESWISMLDIWKSAISVEQLDRDRVSSALSSIGASTLLTPELPPGAASTAELLSVFLLPTLSLGSLDTQLRHTWDHGQGKDLAGIEGTNRTYDFNTTETFRAGIRSQEYTSGHINSWQRLFYPVLGLAFALNLLCLGYLLWCFGLIDDITEPQNHFSLAMISEPCKRMDGSYPKGPEKQHLEVPWRVSQSSVNGGCHFDHVDRIM